MSAADLIRKWEGCRLKAYRDAVGVLTIGYGHTGPDVTEGLEWTQEQADEALTHDMQWAKDAVQAQATRTLKPNEEAAFVSLTYNIGASAFANSETLRLFNANDPVGAALALIKWHKAGGKPLKGLLRRRLEEAMVFLS
jgi:lysozyme